MSLPLYSRPEIDIELCGRECEVELTTPECGQLDDFYCMNCPVYGALMERFRAHCKAQKIPANADQLVCWRPSDPPLTPLERKLLKPICRTVSEYPRMRLNGLTFKPDKKAASSAGSATKPHPRSVIAVPYVKEFSDGTGALSKKAEITAFGIITPSSARDVN